MTIHIGTSWKMNKTIDQARDFMGRLDRHDRWPDGVVPFVLPPHTALHAARLALDPASPVRLGAQNAHWLPAGAVTGEVSMEMIRDAGAVMVELGHSERRAAFGETDETVALKTAAALRAGIQPLVCVGEPRTVRDAGGATSFVLAQAEAALRDIDPADRHRVLIAYEPIWSIGVDGTPAHPGDVAEQVAALRGIGVGAVLYGGSVDTGNVADLLGIPGIGGVFVGRAAWEPEGFLALVDIAADRLGDDSRTPAGR